MDYHKTQLLGTLKFENYWVNPKTDFVDPHRTENGQNAPSCSGLSCKVSSILKLFQAREN